MGLIANNLFYSYPAGVAESVSALSGVSLSLERGSFLIVAGSTGSGKSTLLRLLAGLQSPTQGTVLVDGIDVTEPATRGQIAIVFQNPESQFFAETLESDVAFGPRNVKRPDPSACARAALAAVGLDPDVYGGRSPFTLSGGEARRAAIAGALALQAPYLLLDEPTAGLDPRGRNAVLDVLAAERERAGIVVVTHDPEEFLGLASHVLVLSDGTATFSGTVHDLFSNPPAYECAGLALPALIQIQLDCRERGMDVPVMEFDPQRVAAVLLDARRQVGKWRENQAAKGRLGEQ